MRLLWEESSFDESLLEKSIRDEFLPVSLHRSLEEAPSSHDDVVSWLPHGRSFRVHDRERFVREVMPTYLPKQTG